MRSWERAIPKTDLEVHAAAGYGKPLGLGTRPAALVVDVNCRFLGHRPEPILLIQSRVDTLLVAGCTTSGCVRATAVDAASYGFRVGVVEDCVFDRFEISHNVALFDMNSKYADIIELNDVDQYLNDLPER